PPTLQDVVARDKSMAKPTLRKKLHAHLVRDSPTLVPQTEVVRLPTLGEQKRYREQKQVRIHQMPDRMRDELRPTVLEGELTVRSVRCDWIAECRGSRHNKFCFQPRASNQTI